MLLVYSSLMIIFGFIEVIRLDETGPMYTAPAVNPWTGRNTTKVEAWIGRMIGDGLLLGALFVIGSFLIKLF